MSAITQDYGLSPPKISYQSAGMATTARKVLMLHGYTQNATIFSKRMGAIRKACGKDVEFVFVDGPLVLHPVDLVGDPAWLPPAEGSAGDPSLIPRAWWRANAERTEVHGLEDSLAVLRDVLKANRFDGVFGFSQGAALAALLSALLERPHVHDPFLVHGEPPHPPFKFCVAVSGFKPPGALSSLVFGSSYSTHTLHIIGANDVIVVRERSEKLLGISANKRLEEHDSGHFVPSKTNWRAFFRDFLSSNNPFEVPFPGNTSAASSAPGSGAATPTNSMTASVMRL